MIGACSFNVKDFGAHGDGTGDDTAAIQKALDEAGKTCAGVARNLSAIAAGTAPM